MVIADLTDGKDTQNNNPEWGFDKHSGQFLDKDGEPLAFTFNPQQSVFHTSNGTALELGDLDEHAITMFTQRFTEKHEPVMPKRAVEYEDGKFFLQADPHDEAYKKAVRDFNFKLNLALARYAIVQVVKNDMPHEDDLPQRILIKFEQSMAESWADKKYLWVTSQMQSEIERDAFLSIINGKNIPTAEAIRTAEARFPGDGQSNGSQPVSDPAAAGGDEDNPRV